MSAKTLMIVMKVILHLGGGESMTKHGSRGNPIASFDVEDSPGGKHEEAEPTLML